MERSLQVHPIEPVFDESSRILLLGSFPSVKSREAAFYYAHPKNRFWPVLEHLLGERVPETAEGKRALLLRRGVALWDVVGRCEIACSSDASIRAAEPNDLGRIFSRADIEAVFCNGGTAYDAYCRLCRERTGREAVRLPSTSPANARWGLWELVKAWGDALAPYLS